MRSVGSGSATRHASTAPISLQPLPGNFRTELRKAAEPGHVRASEARNSGSVKYVGVLQMGGVGTSILGRPRLSPSHRRASQARLLPQLCTATLSGFSCLSRAPVGDRAGSAGRSNLDRLPLHKQAVISHTQVYLLPPTTPAAERFQYGDSHLRAGIKGAPVR